MGSPTFSRADKISGTTPVVNGILKSFFPFPANTRVLCLSCAAGVDSMLHIEVRVRQARARFRDFNPISRLSHQTDSHLRVSSINASLRPNTLPGRDKAVRGRQSAGRIFASECSMRTKTGSGLWLWEALQQVSSSRFTAR